MQRRLFLGAAAAAAAAAPGAALLAASAPVAPAARASGAAASGRAKFPNVLLTTHRGERVRFYDDVVAGNHINVINMMYTQCPEVCGGTVANLARVQELLGARMGSQVRFWSLTLDARHDTPAVLARYAELVGAGPDWSFLSGRSADLERLRRALGFVDRDAAVDADRTQHTGMIRAGNDALDRWVSCPGLAPARQLAQELLWIGIGSAGQAA